MASTYEMQSMKEDDSDFNFTEWGVKSKIISRENTKSRRYSASIIRSIRDDTNSFRSNLTISSTASSPGYTLKDEIDPSTYSFTTALKALQARSVYKSWECLSPDGFALNSKWNEAEKYICNPLSGEVPMECLSAKTLSGRLFQNSTINRITMSAPMLFSSKQFQTKTMPSTFSFTKDDVALQFHSPEKKEEEMTRDACTQSTTLSLSSSSNPSTTLTPSTIEISTNENSLNSDENKIKFEEEVRVEQKETGETAKEIGRRMQGGCFSWIRKKNRREKERVRNNNSIFLINLKVC